MFGKIVGGTIGAIIGGPVGAAIGAAIGHGVDDAFEETEPSRVHFICPYCEAQSYLEVADFYDGKYLQCHTCYESYFVKLCANCSTLYSIKNDAPVFLCESCNCVTFMETNEYVPYHEFVSYLEEEERKKEELQSRVLEAFEVLNCDTSYSFEDLRANYKILVRKYHPDKFSNSSIPEELRNLAKEKLQKINESFEFLKNNYYM